MSAITASVTELENINKELSSLHKKMKDLRLRKEKLEKEIIEYLDEKEQPGLKYKNIAIVAEEKEKRLRKKKQEKMNDGIAYLKNNGVHNPEKILQSLLDCMKGDVEEKKVLKMKELK